MRAILCGHASVGAAEYEVLAGRGIAGLDGSFEQALFATIEPWTAIHGALPVVMSGMIGSNVGWRTAPYLECPLPVRSIRDHRIEFENGGRQFSIVPGVSCRNAFGQPDLMRGEELQILGWYRKQDGGADGEHILCLPGTHTKWVRFVGGVIETFTTALTGELYAILRKHSILLPATERESRRTFDESALRDGLMLARDSDGDLLSSLFSVRSRWIADEDSGAGAADALSGLLVGMDVLGAFNRFRPESGLVELIGDGALCRKFAIALENFGFAANLTDGVAAAYHGYRAIDGTA